MEWDLQTAQTLQSRATLWILAVSSLAGLASVAAEASTLALAQSVALWIPSIDKLLTSPPGAGTLAARVAAVNVALLPLYVGLLAYRQNFARSFRASLHRAQWGFVKGTLVVYLGSVPFFAAILSLFAFAPLGAQDPPYLWGEHLLAALIDTPVGLLLLMPPLAVSVAGMTYAIVFACWLPFSFLFNMLRGEAD